MKISLGEVTPEQNIVADSLGSACKKRAPAPVSSVCKNHKHNLCKGTRNDKSIRQIVHCECKCHKIEADKDRA